MCPRLLLAACVQCACLLCCTRLFLAALCAPLGLCVQLETQNKDWEKLKRGDLPLLASQVYMPSLPSDTAPVSILSVRGPVWWLD